jgi:cysteine desulfurase
VVAMNYGNPSSLHQKGVDAEKLLKEARATLAKYLGVTISEVFFTSGGTESNNIAIQGFINANNKRLGAIVTSEIEHPSVLNIFNYYEKQGLKVIYLPVDSKGVISMESLKKALSEQKISMVSVMHVNNEVGSVTPVNEILTLKRQHDFCLHIDAVQSFCKLNLASYSREIDMISFSGHKIHALKGIGGLYIKKGTKVAPVYFGGGQESGVRSGTENIPGIWSLGRAVQISGSGKYNSPEKIRMLRNKLIDKVMNLVANVKLNGSKDEEISAPHIINFSFDGIPGEVMLHALEQKGIYVSTVSACSAKKTNVSHVLAAMGVQKDLIKSAIRISLSALTDEADIEYCGDMIKECVEKLCKK